MDTYKEDQIDAVADYILSSIVPSDKGATVLALEGDLGAGKTTLTKALAAKLGVSETVVSPTFVIAKYYETKDEKFETLVHMDAYRIESLSELGPLGWEALMNVPNTLVVVEWPEKIAGALPEGTYHFVIAHDGDHRSIKRVS